MFVGESDVIQSMVAFHVGKIRRWIHEYMEQAVLDETGQLISQELFEEFLEYFFMEFTDGRVMLSPFLIEILLDFVSRNE